MSLTQLQTSSVPVVSRQSAGMRRLIGLLVTLAAGGILGIAASMQAAEGGLGTHEQLGLPPCGWIVAMDLPCPTCGMTTSFTHAAHGNLIDSFVTQPLGALLALGTAMAFLAGLAQLATGARIIGSLSPLLTRRTGMITAIVLVVAWFYKILSWKGLL